MAKKGLIIGISIGAAAVIATAITVPLVLMNNGGGDVPSKEITLTLNAGEHGYFGETSKKQYEIKGIKEGTTLKDALASDSKYVNPSTNADPLVPQGETTPIPYSFAYYVDKGGQEVKDDFVIAKDITLTANYNLACLSFEVPKDSENDVKAYANSINYQSPYEAPKIKYVDASNPSGAWSDFPTTSADAITIPKGGKIYLKGNNPTGFSYGRQGNYTTFSLKSAVGGGDATVNAYGNIMSLLDDGACKLDTIPCHYCFRYLFSEAVPLQRAPNLPATALKDYCYEYMFYACKKLKIAPNLPAEDLTNSCYSSMFQGCETLEVAPIIVATACSSKPIQSCKNMFMGCSSLKIAPEIYLKSETLEGTSNMFDMMYAHCTKLEKITVHFGAKGSAVWPEGNTNTWLFHAGEKAETQPVFEWVGSTEEIPDDYNHVPQSKTEMQVAWKIVTISE